MAVIRLVRRIVISDQLTDARSSRLAICLHGYDVFLIILKAFDILTSIFAIASKSRQQLNLYPSHPTVAFLQ